MMVDLRHIGSHKTAKVAPNKRKVTKQKPKREPIDLRKYLIPFIRIGSRAGLFLLLGALLAASVRALLKTTTFPVQSVDVRGTQRLNRDEIIALSGISLGNNMLTIPLKTVGRQISSNPWVASVRVQRFFPGTVAIQISERQPVAVVNMGLLYYLDTNGEPFKPLTVGDNLDFPVITGISEEELASDQTGSRQALKSACDLLLALQQHGSFILADVSEIHYDKGRGFILYTSSSNLPIRIGSDEFDNKLQRFARIYQSLAPQLGGVQYIDLDYNDRIVVKKS